MSLETSDNVPVLVYKEISFLYSELKEGNTNLCENQLIKTTRNFSFATKTSSFCLRHSIIWKLLIIVFYQKEFADADEFFDAMVFHGRKHDESIHFGHN